MANSECLRTSEHKAILQLRRLQRVLNVPLHRKPTANSTKKHTHGDCEICVHWHTQSKELKLIYLYHSSLSRDLASSFFQTGVVSLQQMKPKFPKEAVANAPESRKHYRSHLKFAELSHMHWAPLVDLQG